ncbi:MAG: hypothetical protein NVSMB57_02960 [Actinomycetota bacterium]
MHAIAIVALLGLAAYKTVDLLTGLARNEDTRVRLFLSLAMGIVFTELLDYSLFGAWKISVRQEWMGPVFTGAIVGATSYVWHNVLSLVEGMGRRQRDEAIEIEQRIPRAA